MPRMPRDLTYVKDMPLRNRKFAFGISRCNSFDRITQRARQALLDSSRPASLDHRMPSTLDIARKHKATSRVSRKHVSAWTTKE